MTVRSSFGRGGFFARIPAGWENPEGLINFFHKAVFKGRRRAAGARQGEKTRYFCGFPARRGCGGAEAPLFLCAFLRIFSPEKFDFPETVVYYKAINGN